MVEKLKGTINKDIEVIYHLSDIHIRNSTERYDEYKTVFDRLFLQLKKNNRPKLIVVGGDIVHNKTLLRPACIDLVQYFFAGLSEISDVVAIIGNHDTNINNKNGMDSISPIINENFYSDHSIFLLDDDKVYQYNNLLLGVTTIFANKVTPCKIKTKRIKIGLYHGTLKGSKVDNGTTLQETNESYYCNRDFVDYDYVMLGDIHKMQYLNKKKTIAYSSSLIQQNYGESLLSHGYLKWDLVKNRSIFIRVRNDYGFMTAKLDKNGFRFDDDCKNIPKYPRIRLFYKGVSNSVLVKTIAELKQNYKIHRLDTCLDMDDMKIKINMKDNYRKNITLNDINSSSKVKNILTTYIKENKLCKNKEIKYINNHLDKLLKELDYKFDFKVRNISLNKLSFSNLFSYGKQNTIQFNTFNNIVGIVAKNGYGKSSIIDSILFSIYGKYSRGEKYSAVNINEEIANSTLSLNVNGQNYTIEREMKTNHEKSSRRSKNHNIRYSKNNKLITEDTKNLTMKKVGDDICSYESMINTSIILQNGANFIELEPHKRKEYICRLLNLDIFDQLFKRARFQTNSIRQTISIYKKDMNGLDFNELTNINKKLTLREKEYNNTKDELKKNITKLNSNFIELKLKLSKCGFHNTTDIENFNRKYNSKKDKEKIIKTKLKLLKDIVDKNEKNIKKIKKETVWLNRVNIKKNNKEFIQNNKKILLGLNKTKEEFLVKLTNVTNVTKSIYDIKELKENNNNTLQNIKNLQKIIIFNKSKIVKIKKENIIKKEYQSLLNIINNIDILNKELVITKIDTAKSKEGQQKLLKHKYNPKCDVCMENQLTKEKLYFENRIKDLEKIQKLQEDKLTELKKQKKEKIKYGDIYNNLLKNIELNSKLTDDNKNYYNEIQLEKKNVELQEMKIKNYDKILLQIKTNGEIKTKINKINQEIKNIEELTYEDYDKYLELNEQIKKCHDSILNEKNNMHKLELDIGNVKNELKAILLIKNVYDQLLEIYGNDIFKHLKNINSELSNTTDELNKIDKELNKLIRLQSDNKGNMGKYYDLNKKIDELEKEWNINNKLKKFLDKDGLMNFMLNKSILPTIQNAVNSILGFLTNFEISMNFDGTGTHVYKQVGDLQLNCSALSGFEKFIVNMAFRLAFNKLNGRIKTDFLIIDEGFSCCDEDNISKLKSLFEFIRKEYKWCLVITHLEDVKTNFDSIINIDRINGRSKILA